MLFVFIFYSLELKKKKKKGISQIIVLDFDSYVINFMLFDNRAVKVALQISYFVARNSRKIL